MIFLDYTFARIKNSAKKIFHEKGFNGTRVHDIANDADVSQSLLHYYFRTKEQLFKLIVDDSISLIFKSMSPILKKELSFFELIDQFITNILILFKDNKRHLSFIINEYNQNFEKIQSELKPISLFFKDFEHKIRVQSLKENIEIKDTRHLIVNIISLCGWQVIGIHIFNLETNKMDTSNSFDISEARINIYNSVVSSLEIQ
jgi:AcrR family transcriptional regulator